MTRVVVSMTGATLTVFTLVLTLGWGIGAFPLEVLVRMLLLSLPAGAGWWLAYQGRWRWAGYILPATFYLQGLYSSYTFGLAVPALFFVLAVMLAAILRGTRAQWVMLALSIGGYLVAGWLYGDRGWDILIGQGLTVGGSLIGIALLQWFSRSQLENALARAHTYAEELKGYRHHLEELVKERSAELLSTNERLQHQIAKHEQAESELAQKAQDLARSHAFMTALNHVTARIESTRDPEQVLTTLGQELHALGLTCGVVLWEPDRQALLVRYTSIESKALALAENLAGLRLQGYRVPRRARLVKEVFESGRASYLPDPVTMTVDLVPSIPETIVRRAARLVGVGPNTSAIYLPLTVEERLIGMMAVWGPGLHEEDVPALSVFAGQVASSVENARLFQAEQRRTMELSTLLQATRAVASTLDLGEALTTIAEQMVQAADADGCTLSSWDQEADAVVTLIDWRRNLAPAEEPGTSYALREYPATRAVLETRQPLTIHISDPNADPAEVAHMRRLGIANLLMLPLVTSERVIGLLELEDRERERVFGEAEVRLFQALADQAAVAIVNSRLYESVRQELAERRRAETALQQAHDELEHRVQERTAELTDVNTLLQMEVGERKRSEAALGQSVAELQNLQHIANALLSLEELAQVMNTVAQGIVTLLGYDMVLVSRYAEEEHAFTGLALHPLPVPKQFDRILRLVGRMDLKDDPTRYRVPYHRGENPLVDRVLEGAMVTSDSLAELFHPWIPHPAAAAAQKLVGLTAFVDLPMQVKGKTVGTIVAGVRNPPITAYQQQALARVAGQAAVAIENTRLYDAERQRSVELARSNAFITALSQVAARIETTPDPDRVLETLGTELRQLGVTYFLGLLEPDAQEVVGHYTSIQPAALAMAEKVARLSVRSLRLPRERWPVREVIEPGLAHFVPDLVSAVATALPHLPRPVLERAVRLAGVTPGLGAAYLPLKVEDQVLGLMALWGPDLREEDVPALSVFANQVAVAFENARLYERTLREVSARMQAEEKIKASLLEKEILLKEIHHRVKNNLQVVSSLLNLQSAHIRDPRTLEIFRDSQNRIRSMALIHEKLYQSQELAKVDFAEYARNLAAYLFRVYGDKAQSVTLDVEVEGVLLEIDTAVLCGLILNELISNSLKHAFPDGRSGRICIGLQARREGQLNLEVGDNGVGLPSDLDLGNTESLGIQLVNTLVDQLGGRLEYNSRNGTNFKIAFSVSEDRD